MGKSSAVDFMVGTTKKLRSNQAINGAFDYLVDGGANLGKFGKSVIKDGNNIQKAAEDIYKQGDKWNVGAIAGSYIVGTGAARLASGGGLTRDRNGNQDIIGIPFI